MDFLEGLPLSQGKNVIKIFSNRSPKYACFLNLSHPCAVKVVVEKLVEGVVTLQGIPKSIISDRDTITLSPVDLWIFLEGRPLSRDKNVIFVVIDQLK